MRSDFWIIALILGVVFSALLAFSYINRRSMGPARKRARAEQDAFCRVHGSEMGMDTCRRLFVGLPPAVWDDLAECRGTEDPVACRVKRLCDMGSAMGCLAAGRVSGDHSLVARACRMGYSGPECTSARRHIPDIQAAMMGLTPDSHWSWETLAYACGEGDARACGLIPSAWFGNEVREDALVSLTSSRTIWTEACLWGDMHSCTMAALSWRYDPLMIYSCLEGSRLACRYAGIGNPALGDYLAGIHHQR